MQIARKRVKKPQRRVGGVIEAGFLSFREQIGDQSVANVMREGAQDPPRFGAAASDQRQTFQADHGVAAPIAEPVIAGDYGADLFPGSARPHPILMPARRLEQELIRSTPLFG